MARKDENRVALARPADGFGPRRLLRGTMLAVAAKLALLALLYFVFFSPAHRPDLNGALVADRILGRAQDKGAPP
jgi:hypothetical protein